MAVKYNHPKAAHWPNRTTDSACLSMEKARVVDLKDLSTFFGRRGFSAIALNQRWRHVDGELERDGLRYFFKFGSTLGISRKTYNEYQWIEQFGRLCRRRKNFPLLALSVVKTGRYQHCFYYITEFVKNQPICLQNKVDVVNIQRNLNAIAELAAAIQTVKDFSFSNDQAYQRVKYPERKFARWNKFRLRESKRSDLGELYELASEITRVYEPGLNHGDFTPWHMIPCGRQILLVDSEHATSMLPRYYAPISISA